MTIPAGVMKSIVKMESGFFVFWPERQEHRVYYTSHNLREIAEELDRRNHPLVEEFIENCARVR